MRRRFPNPKNKMNPTQSRSLLRATASALLLGTAALVSAQTAPAEKKDDVITLPTFTITETPENPYRSRQALSASRVAMDLQDIPQTVSVVTSDFIKDSFAHRMLDAAKYITPVAESSLPIGGDRYQIRGFQVSHEFIDGAESSGADGYSMSIAPYNIERIEIIKGPNAILVPGGSPGGQFNPITKSPILKDQTSLTLDFAQYFTNSLSVDINRIVSQEKGMAARVVAAYWNSTGYLKNHQRNGWMFAPSFSMQLSPNHKFVAKAEIMRNDEAQIGGVPLDPSIGTAGATAIIAKNLPRDWTFGDGILDTRHRETERLTLELLSTLGDHVTSRLQLIGNHVIREDAGGTGAAIIGAGGTGSRNPNTGLYEPGVIWSLNQTGAFAIATSTTVPLPDPSTYVYQRNYGAVDLYYWEAHLRNDYAIKFEGETWKSTLITGLAANHSKVQFKSYAAQARPNVPGNNLASTTYPSYVYPEPTLLAGGNRTGEMMDLQLFAFESASLFRDRLLLSGGVSRYFGRLTRTDNTGIGVPVAPAPYYPSYGMSSNAVSWGVVVKPIKNVSLFYGYNTSGGAMPGQLNAGGHAPDFRVQVGNQKEFGVKTTFLDGKLNLAFSHFDITQSNYPVPNSEYYVLVANGIPVPADFPTTLYLNQVSKGWEFEGSYAVNKNLTVFANYSDYKARQATGVRIRGNPDTIGAFFVDYQFSEGLLNGFGFNIGVDKKSDAAGDNVSGFTTAKPLPGDVFVLQQPSFYVGGRTLVNVGFSYKTKGWTARLQVANALDEDYILAAGSRTAVIAADPRNLKFSLNYKY